jgi:hypothetical protein
MIRGVVFQVIADPTRRGIINIVAARSLLMNAVAGEVPVSPTAIYKPVIIHSESGFIVMNQLDRDRYQKASLDRLNVESSWVDRPEVQDWDFKRKARSFGYLMLHTS